MVLSDAARVNDFLYLVIHTFVAIASVIASRYDTLDPGFSFPLAGCAVIRGLEEEQKWQWQEAGQGGLTDEDILFVHVLSLSLYPNGPSRETDCT